jgi:hypothetical protein
MACVLGVSCSQVINKLSTLGTQCDHVRKSIGGGTPKNCFPRKEKKSHPYPPRPKNFQQTFNPTLQKGT